jgi:23S rRNA (pseudouridine1915-N3)-methyltransferase
VFYLYMSVQPFFGRDCFTLWCVHRQNVLFILSSRATMLISGCFVLSLVSPHATNGAVVARSTSHRSTCIRLGPRVRIVSVGSKRRDEPWIQEGIELYTKRLKPVLGVECIFVKDDAALLSAVEKSDEVAIILDERGALSTSVQFTDRLFDALEEGGARMSFFIGGAEGLPPELKADPKRLLSLGRLTLPHQMARLVLVEQIYRASEIRRGSGYHKD